GIHRPPREPGLGSRIARLAGADRRAISHSGPPVFYEVELSVPVLAVGQTIVFCGLPGPGGVVPTRADDEKRSSAPQVASAMISKCHSPHLFPWISPPRQ